MSYPIGNNNTASRTNPGRYDKDHGDEGTLDLEPHMEGALEHVVETIMNFGVYPQPRCVGLFMTTGSNRRTEFDLYDDLIDEKFIEHADLLEFFILSMNDAGHYGSFYNLRSSWEKRLEKYLSTKLQDSSMVREKAEEYMEEELEEA